MTLVPAAAAVTGRPVGTGLRVGNESSEVCLCHRILGGRRPCSGVSAVSGCWWGLD
jgi:hypothetical protein